MKKVIILLMILITVSKSFGQLSPVMPYNNTTGYSLSDVKTLALGTSAKSLAFKNCLVEKLSTLLKDTLQFSSENLAWAFQFMFSEERTLKAGEYQNSGLNLTTGKIEFFPGKDWVGFVWVFRIGSYETVICKGNCCNPLNVVEQKMKIVQQTTPQQAQTTSAQITNTTKTGASFIPDNRVNNVQTNVSGQVNVHVYGEVYSTPTGAVFTPNTPNRCYYPRYGYSYYNNYNYGGYGYYGGIYVGAHW